MTGPKPDTPSSGLHLTTLLDLWNLLLIVVGVTAALLLIPR